MTRTVRRIRHRSQITRDMILNTRSHTIPSKRKFEEDDDKALEEEFDLDEEFE